MRKPWGRRMKQLFREAPQDLVEWILSDARFITVVSPELDGRGIHRFDFQVIRLWEIPKHTLKEKALVGLLPLLVLTQVSIKR